MLFPLSVLSLVIVHRFFSGFGMDTYRGQRGFQSQRRRHLKRGCCFSCYFPLFFLPAKSKTIWEEELYWVQANGVRVGCKAGYIGFGVGWEGKISHVQNVASVAGLGLIFSSFHFRFLFTPSKSASLGSPWTGLNGCLFRPDTLHYPQHSCIHKCYLSPAKHKKKALVSKEWAGATGEFFYMKGYGVFCCFSYESFSVSVCMGVIGLEWN